MVFRLSFILLVLANLVLLAWSQGYLGGIDGGREPQRLAKQLHADQLRIVRDAPATPQRLACAAIDKLTPSELDTLEKTVAGGGGSSLRRPVLAYRLLIPALADQAAAEKKLAELRQLGIHDGDIVALPDGRREIVLAGFNDVAAAQTALAALTRQGTRSVRLEEAPPSPMLEVRAPVAVLDHLKTWLAPFPAARVGECAP
jgi:hypothetical protein